MNLPKYLLSALFAMMAAVCIVKFFTEGLSPIAIIFFLGYLCMVASLNQRWGQPALIVSYFVAGLMSLLLIGALGIALLAFLGQSFESVLFFVCLVFGSIGILTIFTIENQNAKSI